MDENAIKSVLRSDARVKELITSRAYQIYLERGGVKGNAANDWKRAESEIIDELTEKLIDAQAESWRVIEQHQPEFQLARTFATLTGFMLAQGGVPTRANLYDSRFYIIGLSYISGMFEVGRSQESSQFLRIFSNARPVLHALRYRLRTNPESPYYTVTLSGDLSVQCETDQELQQYLSYAEKEITEIYQLFRRMLMSEPAAVGV